MSKKIRSAYSLLELSIVIVIISILITGAMTVSVGNINNAKIKVTKDKMQMLNKALGNFVAINGRLPCPAAVTLAKGDSSGDYGKEVGAAGTCATASKTYQSSTNTNLVYGMIPVTTLGLSQEFAEDGWGSKIAYIVDKNFTKAANTATFPDFSQTDTFSIAASLNSSNNITISSAVSGGYSPCGNCMLTLISYGPNKLGAFPANSTTRNARSDDSYERENDIDDNNDFNKDFVDIVETTDKFDDIVFFVNARMFISFFDLYRLLPCNNNLDANYNRNGQSDAVSPDSTSGSPNATNDIPHNAWFGQTVYGTTCAAAGSSDSDKNYTKTCGLVGVWVVKNNCSLP